MNTQEKLDRLEDKISSKEFRENLGSANEVSYFIFDYDPKEEITVRKYLRKLTSKINSKDYYDFHIVNFDIYDMIIEYLSEEDNLIQEVIGMESSEGFDEVSNSIKDAMGVETLNDNYYIKRIKEETEKDSVVFITGLGKAYPIVRVHKILKNLHLTIENVPVIVFVPGTYSGTEIKLFGRLNANYYRAFKLFD